MGRSRTGGGHITDESSFSVRGSRETCSGPMMLWAHSWNPAGTVLHMYSEQAREVEVSHAPVVWPVIPGGCFWKDRTHLCWDWLVEDSGCTNRECLGLTGLQPHLPAEWGLILLLSTVLILGNRRWVRGWGLEQTLKPNPQTALPCLK